MTDELSPSEVARRLGTSTRTVQRWIERGSLPARRVGGRWRVASDAFGAIDAPRTSLEAHPPTEPVPTAPIRTLFIANRGEIASRITRTCRDLGIAAVVPQTIGPAALDLLDIDAVVGAARAAGADAIHPGFGFLAENADFAEAVIAAGIRWVGPPPEAIRAMGDKAAARRLAAGLGVPVPAGYDDADQAEQTLTEAAARIGYPLLVKPAAGGGGKGMRTVRDPGAFGAALSAARREAGAAFGDDRLILERLVEGARHVEIQVLFDGHGDGVHLGERDCSLQRRHQKVLEEAPSPAVGADLRARMGADALRLGAAVGYVGAGTCEFLLDDGGAYPFLEMNTRLQVEHPVTELVTGRDLVADQLRIAAGGRLDLVQGDVSLDGHAVEVRLYAEDADAGFLPATGTIGRLRWPVGDGVRVDAGVAEGDVVSARFDPMLAKVVAWGVDRDQALDRLAAALDQTIVLGLTTNLAFLRWLVRQPAVRAGDARTDTLETLWPPHDGSEPPPLPDDAWSTAANALMEAAPADALGDPPTGDPWRDGFRLNARPSIRLETGEEARMVSVEARGDHEAVRIGAVVHVDVGGRSVPFRLAAAPDVDRAVRAAAATHPGGPADVLAPMPGSVLATPVSVGAPVGAGDPVVVLEAMKMEHAVVAPLAGRLTELRVAVGDQVGRGQIVAVVEPERPATR